MMYINEEKIDEIKRILDKYIHLGDSNSICHDGICSIIHCARCKDAVYIRAVFNELTK